MLTLYSSKNPGEVAYQYAQFDHLKELLLAYPNLWLHEADLRGQNLSNTNLVGKSFKDCDLRKANFESSNLDGFSFYSCDLREASFKGAYVYGCTLDNCLLEAADLSPWREDIFKVLDKAPDEVANLLTAMETGQINGSQYSGICRCLKGTLAGDYPPWTSLEQRQIHGYKVDSLVKDPASPAEMFFFPIRKGDTPDTNSNSRQAAIWVKEWLTLNQGAQNV